MGERMVELARRFPNAEGPTRKALDQAAREVMLAQASDWAFIMKAGTTVSYANKQTHEHVTRFTKIYDRLSTSTEVDGAWLEEVERRMAQAQRGETAFVDAEQVLARMRQLN